MPRDLATLVEAVEIDTEILVGGTPADQPPLAKLHLLACSVAPRYGHDLPPRPHPRPRLPPRGGAEVER